eukprot:gnl/MRDRNA2_/MRDRNA2_72359_c0_seq1.p1 gnl/MRDRNA2_/MRDRNA2_72359_c0~~gnl/MRDRNA2_/MRDRNA2_72359_c0_seq1.p1  ORF type:complete len:401 (+),score=67.38 gnl/MRDRNA2_/MRDRNA2_72359_c0_seq1:76-1278(+)
MKLLVVALLSFISLVVSFTQSQVCYTGPLKIANITMSEDKILTALESQVNAAVLHIANGDKKLMDYLRMSGNCQADCLALVIKPTLQTLYGKLGNEFASRHKKRVHDDFVEAVFGAFRACYPHPPRQDVKQVAETVIKSIGVIPHASATFPAGVACPNQGHEDDFPLNDFLKSFEDTIMRVMAKKAELRNYFETRAKDCQKTCLSGVVPVSAMTLFLTNTDDPAAGIDALTGAIHACFPDVPHEDINMLVSETKDVMDDAEAAAAYTKQMMEQAAARRRQLDKIPLSRGASRRRAEKKDRRRATLVHTQESLPKQQQQQLQQEKEVQRQQEETGSIGAFSLFSTVMAVSLLCLTAGLFLGRRFNVSSVRSVGTVGSYQLLPTSLGSSGSALTSTYTPPQF